MHTTDNCLTACRAQMFEALSQRSVAYLPRLGLNELINLLKPRRITATEMLASTKLFGGNAQTFCARVRVCAGHLAELHR